MGEGGGHEDADFGKENGKGDWNRIGKGSGHSFDADTAYLPGDDPEWVAPWEGVLGILC